VAGAADERRTRVPAVLSGVDSPIIATCIVETWAEHSSWGKAYTRCRIINDPADLPDGRYIVEFGDRRIPTNKYQGHWELVFLAPEVRLSRAA